MNDRTYLFYQLLGYPLPSQQDYFAYDKKIIDDKVFLHSDGFSWPEENKYLEEYRSYIQRFHWLRSSLPFVESIYLCNSISFNALDSKSDIDLFFVVKEGRMWLARWWSTVMFIVLGIKRFGPRVRKKFCLSFYVSEHHLDLQPIKLLPSDPYLIYWLAHLVPLYLEHGEESPNIYSHNSRLQSYLPNHPGEHVIDLGIPTISGSSRFKQWIERALSGRIGDMAEIIIKGFWLPILFWKKRRLGVVGESIILSDVMLKFYADQRHLITTKWKIALK